MSYFWEMVVFSALAVVGVAGQTAISLLRRPQWLEGDASLSKNWSRLAVYSGVSGLLFGALALTVNLSAGWRGQGVLFAAVGGYVLFQSLFTDLRVRRVDRWVQRLGNLLALIAGIYVLSVYGVELDFVLFLVFLVVTIALGFLPGIGDSDGRAYSYIVLATYPVVGIAGVQWAAIGMLASIIIYYVALSAHRKTFKLKDLLTKESFPMVPLIMLPAVLVSIFGRLLPGF